jgi:protein phosphatase
MLTVLGLGAIGCLGTAAWFGLPWRRRHPALANAPLQAPPLRHGPESRIVVASASDPGCVRDSNEDRVRIVRPLDETGPLLAVVCDGMGGHAAGERASQLAADVIALEYDQTGDPGHDLVHALGRANHAVYHAARHDPDCAGMGTTCTALVLRGGRAWCAHVGDSRCYLIREGELFVMTEDHSAVMALVRGGSLSRTDARTHPDRNVISRALGSHPQVDVATWPRPFEVRPGDRFLLSSDGLHDVIPEVDLLALASASPPHRACADLITATRQAGAPDNVSVILLAIPAADPGGLRVTRPIPIAS